MVRLNHDCRNHDFTCWRTLLLIKQNSKRCWFFLHPFQFNFDYHPFQFDFMNIISLSIHEPCTFAEKLFKYVFEDRSIAWHCSTHSDFQFWLPFRRFHPCRRKVNDIFMYKAIPDIRLSWFRVTVFISTETRKCKWYWQVDLTDCPKYLLDSHYGYVYASKLRFLVQYKTLWFKVFKFEWRNVSAEKLLEIHWLTAAHARKHSSRMRIAPLQTIRASVSTTRCSSRGEQVWTGLQCWPPDVSSRVR